MKKIDRIFLALIMVIAVQIDVHNASAVWVHAPSSTDLWDITSGNVQILDNSPVNVVGKTFYIDAIFGGVHDNSSNDTDIKFNTVFADYQPNTFVDYVTWRTSTPVHLTEFRLFSTRDNPGPEPPPYREITYFKLFYSMNGVNWFLADEKSTSALYGNEWGMEYTKTGLDITAAYFKAEFSRRMDLSTAAGPRIVELDGFGTPVPIPSTVWLLGTALMAFPAIRRKLC